MIVLDCASKHYATRSGRRIILSGVSASLPPVRDIGILAESGSGKTTLLNLLAGTEPLTRGRIHRTVSVSQPLGQLAGLDPHMTGRDAIRLRADMAGQSEATLFALVNRFSQLDTLLNEPVGTLSAGARLRLAMGLTFAQPHDCYLIDDDLPMVDAEFAAKCREALAARRTMGASIIMASSCRESLQAIAGQVDLRLADGKLMPDTPIQEAA
ncbi:MAG: ABC transporter ATP-binding protein [Alphaproteobacteria bacterium]